MEDSSKRAYELN